MRPISGLERPWAQWLIVGLCALLITVTASVAIGLRAASREIARLRAADLEARVEREQLERRLAREQSTRESLTLELSRHRTRAAAAGELPTLTLSPLRTRGAAPPEATVVPPPPTQLIDLRLVLPRGAERRYTHFVTAMRSWSGGDPIWSRGQLAPSLVDGRSTIVVRVPGEIFTPGAYEIAVTGAGGGPEADVASYELTVGAAR
jgi:hypothetical protein